MAEKRITNRRPGIGVEWPGPLMAWIAGNVDAIGYLTLGKLFTAHMSGNTAAMGAHLGQSHWLEGLRRGFPIPVFVAGVATGTAMDEIGRRRKARRPEIAAVLLEIALLAAFLVWGGMEMRRGAISPERGPLYYALTALPAFAMGVQNAVLRRIDGVSLRTTYVSGMLTNWAEQTVATLFWIRDRAAGRGARRFVLAIRVSARHASAARARLYFGVWIAFAAGAVLGSVAEGAGRMWALALPLSGLIVYAAAGSSQEPATGQGG